MTEKRRNELKYQLCQNVTLEQVCGTNLLIAYGEALQRFDYVRVLNEVGADILAMVEKGNDAEEIIQDISKLYEMDAEDIRPGILRFLDEMETIGYLLPLAGGEK